MFVSKPSCNMIDEQLINAVRDHPDIYDPRVRGYKDQDKKEQAWRIISEEIKQTVTDCKYRWKSLRDKYVREKKKMKDLKRSGVAAISIRMWPLMGILGFLEDTISHRSSFSNMTSNNEEPDRIASSILKELATGAETETRASDECEKVMQNTSDSPPLCYSSSESLSESLIESINPILPVVQNCPIINSQACSTASTGPKSNAEPNTTVPSLKITPGTRKRKMDPVEKYLVDVIKTTSDKLSSDTRNTEPDEDELYLLSLKPYLKSLNERSKSLAKIKILETLHELKFQ